MLAYGVYGKWTYVGLLFFLSSSLYLNLVLGNVNVTLLSNQAKWVSASMHIHVGLAVGVCWSPETGMVFYYIWLLFWFGLWIVSGLKKWSHVPVKLCVHPLIGDILCSVLCAFQVRLQRWVWEVQTLSHNYLVTWGRGLQIYSSLQVRLLSFCFCFDQEFWIKMYKIRSQLIWTNCLRWWDTGFGSI